MFGGLGMVEMILIFLLVLLLFGAAQERPTPTPPAQGTLTVRHRQIIVRVPSGVREVAPAGASLMKWREGRG